MSVTDLGPVQWFVD
ncbi:hypothetical protein D9611_010400 [Ephemerocybe angulata]|uniref:Uncharacterized protein n=1 Tax=Ephemerocybe angulata TaxID=980116 RepID=A0A8H5BUT1_9AGAR|nr:hypothetical protein D9611_010400 [Tulosesus angulatus]